MQALDQGLPVRTGWIFSSEQLALLQAVVGDTPPDRVRPLLEQLPPDLRYEHVQLYRPLPGRLLTKGAHARAVSDPICSMSTRAVQLACSLGKPTVPRAGSCGHGW